MSQKLQTRLDQILAQVVSKAFLEGQGIGNEIGFYIFDYPAEQELQVRSHLGFLEKSLAKKHARLKYIHINLLDLLLDYLDSRKLLDKAIELQKRKGDAALIKALSGPLHIDKVTHYLIESRLVKQCDMVFLSGVGSVWPLLRTHHLLNGLHAILGHKPLLLFYPGEYSGQDMSLFGKIKSDNYYRAFKLIP